MADPILDEENILALLQLPLRKNTVHVIQAGAAQAVMAMYDRKVLRDAFADGLAAAFALQGIAARYGLLMAVKEEREANTITEERLADADAKLQELVAKQADVVIKMIEHVMQCPTSEDKIN